MPISEYFGGHGTEVMKELKAKHGEEAGERIFYATANKEGQKLAEDAAARHSRLHAALDRVMDARCAGRTSDYSRDPYEVEEYRVWVNQENGRTASIKGAVPWTSAAEKPQWKMESHGWTIYDRRDNTSGLGMKPFASRAEAQAWVDRKNAEYNKRLEEYAKGGARDGGYDSRAARLHRALDRVMDNCGYGKDNANPNVIKEIEKRFAYGRPTGHRFTEAELAEMRRSAESKNAKPAGHELQAKDSAYSLTARDQGFLRSILEGATEAVRGGLGAMTPGGDRK